MRPARRLGLAAVCGLAAALCLAGSLWAASSDKPLNPSLLAEDWSIGTDEEPGRQPLKIDSLNIAVEVRGATAHTTVTAAFSNRLDTATEGDFTLDLPAGSLITGYALDIENTEGDKIMIPGVLVGRRQAVLAYESVVRRGVDPGLAGVSRTNAFQTRVFPIPREGRTIRLEFVTPLAADRPFVLPLVTGEPIGRTRITVTVHDLKAPPSITGPDGRALAWSAVSGGVATGEWAEQRLDGALTLAAAVPAAPLSFTRHRSGDLFFDIVDGPARAAAPAKRPASVQVYWDRSLSRGDDDLAGEADLLRLYLTAVAPGRIELIDFASDTPRRRVFADAGSVDRAVRDLTYLGATSLSGVFENEGKADVCLLFTDGRLSLDAWRMTRRGCRLMTLSSAPDADDARLAGMARRSDGAYIDLTVTGSDAALRQLTGPGPAVVAVTDAHGSPVDALVLEDGEAGYRLIGQASSPGEVQVRLASGEVRRYRPPPGRPAAFDGVAALWGARSVADGEVSEKPDLDRLVKLSQRYSVAGSAASFVVLEEMWDYADAGLTPPEAFGPEFLADYRENVAEIRRDEREAVKEAREELYQQWGELKEWWRQDFDIDPETLADLRKRNGDDPDDPAQGGRRRGWGGGGGVGELGDSGVGEVIVTAQLRPPPAPETAATGPRIAIEIADWAPDRPYLKALDTVGLDGFGAEFRSRQKTSGHLPAFYLDVAEWLYRKGRKAEAVQMALSALDTPQAGSATLFTVADRMMRYGETDRGLWMYDRLTWLEPDRPQPTRALALALVDVADRPGATLAVRRSHYERAAKLLNTVATRKWHGAYDGIQLVALMEANRLIPALREMGVTHPILDPRLTDLLDVDLRVVLEWNTDATDMDLWVIEPSNEVAIYSNPATQIGGRLSNDMTAGYGPEEYLLRRAPDGTYIVKADIYAADRIDPNGATVIRAWLYRDWGRPTQRREAMEIELTRQTEGAQLVGKFTVKR